jgi:hypothetical protein
MTDICYVRSSVIRYRGLWRYLRRSTLRVAIVAVPADLVVSQGTTVQPNRTVGSGSAITWLTNAPTRLRWWICCRAFLLLCPYRAIQLGGVAVQFNGLLDDLVQTMAPPQFFLMRPSIDIPAKAAQVLSRDRRILRSEQRIPGVWCRGDRFSGGIVRRQSSRCSAPSKR